MDCILQELSGLIHMTLQDRQREAEHVVWYMTLFCSY